MRAVLSPPAPRPARAELGADPRDIEERLSPRPCSSSATTATATVFINPAHVASRSCGTGSTRRARRPANTWHSCGSEWRNSKGSWRGCAKRSPASAPRSAVKDERDEDHPRSDDRNDPDDGNPTGRADHNPLGEPRYPDRRPARRHARGLAGAGDDNVTDGHATQAGRVASRQITMRSISSSVTVSAVRSYSFVVLGDAWPAICWACSSAVMPVARNVWQQVDVGRPAAAARRLIIASTTRRVSDRPLRRPDRSTPGHEDRPATPGRSHRVATASRPASAPASPLCSPRASGPAAVGFTGSTWWMTSQSHSTRMAAPGALWSGSRSGTAAPR